MQKQDSKNENGKDISHNANINSNFTDIDEAVEDKLHFDNNSKKNEEGFSNVKTNDSNNNVQDGLEQNIDNKKIKDKKGNKGNTIEDQLKIALANADEWKDKAIRTQAELQNYRKRIAKEKSETIRYANSELLESLIPIIDNFALGLQATNKSYNNNPEIKNLVMGMEMVLKQIQDFLSDNGVKEIEAENKKFDPHLHDAVEQVNDPKIKEGYVISVLRKGYKLNDRLIRPSQIVVSKGK